jgi:hypothetical protein
MIEFDKFWKAWPRKVSRKTAETKWNKLTHDQQRAALADVEKRSRMNAWSSNPKLIPHATTYLNQERWDDEWEAELKAERSQDKPNTGAYVPPPRPDEPKLSWQEQMLNRLFRTYCLSAGGLGKFKDPKAVDAALKEKRHVLNIVVPAFNEDIESDRMDKQQAAYEIAEIFLKRLDQAYSKNLSPLILKRAQAAAKYAAR